MAVFQWANRLACLLTVLCISVGLSSATPLEPAGLGSSCTYDGMCTIPNSYCQPYTHQCVCKSGYVHSISGDRCVSPPKASMGDPCETAEDCANIKEVARCSSEGVCTPCSQGTEREYSECTETRSGCAYHEYDKICWLYRKLGEDCTHDEECWIKPDFNKKRHCFDKMCQCKPGYVMMSGHLPHGVVDQCMSPGSGLRTTSSISLIVFLVSLVNYMRFVTF